MVFQLVPCLRKMEVSMSFFGERELDHLLGKEGRPTLARVNITSTSGVYPSFHHKNNSSCTLFHCVKLVIEVGKSQGCAVLGRYGTTQLCMRGVVPRILLYYN